MCSGNSGPTFADYYMSELENKLLSEPDECNPLYYRSYVNNILTIFKNKSSTGKFRNKLASTTVLDFFHELSQNHHFQFTDVKLNRTLNLSFTTTVYIKPADNGLYLNSASHTHINYSKSVIKTLAERALNKQRMTTDKSKLS